VFAKSELNISAPTNYFYYLIATIIILIEKTILSTDILIVWII